jgi:hypothetical protein
MGKPAKYPALDAHGRKRTPYAVHCEGPWDLPGGGCGLVYLTENEYERQMFAPSKTWRCPICKYEAQWSDKNFETFKEATCKE